MPEPLVEGRVERDRVQRHLDIDSRRELSADSAHALACRAFALMAFAFEDEDILLPCCSEVVGDARTDDAATDDQHIRRLHRALVYATKKRTGKISPVLE